VVTGKDYQKIDPKGDHSPPFCIKHMGTGHYINIVENKGKSVMMLRN